LEEEAQKKLIILTAMTTENSSNSFTKARFEWVKNEKESTKNREIWLYRIELIAEESHFIVISFRYLLAKGILAACV
jgi:hypothetical protein